MTDKQIIVNVNKCKYRDTYTNFCKAEKDDIGECHTICTGNDCYYKQLKRAEKRIVDLNKTIQAKEKEYEKLKQTLTEIKDYCNKYPQNSIGFKKYILQKISESEV